MKCGEWWIVVNGDNMGCWREGRADGAESAEREVTKRARATGAEHECGVLSLISASMF